MVIALLPAAVETSSVTDSTLDCLARGSHEWLSTRPSPLDSATLVLGEVRVRVCYSQPSLRGRAIESLVPASRAWRTGANEPTTVALSGRASVGGAVLPAGRYVLLSVPGPDEWTLVFHTTPEIEPARMFATLRAVGQGRGTVERLAASVERFTIRAEGQGDSTALLLEWGDRRVRVPVRSAP